jgi:hypothetical protein
VAWQADAPSIPDLIAEIDGVTVTFPNDQKPGPHGDGILVYITPGRPESQFPTPPVTLRKAGGRVITIAGGVRSARVVAAYDQMIDAFGSGELSPGAARVFDRGPIRVEFRA